MEDRFLPQRATIEGFGAGGFRFGGYSHLGSLLVLPSGMRAWSPRLIAEVTPADLAMVLQESAVIDFVLIGTGSDVARLPQAAGLALKGINFDCMTTSAAVSTYNVMLAEDRRVAACLIAVDKAHAR
jgi:uncharacterized protein